MPINASTESQPLVFRLKYIAAPMILAILVVVIALSFLFFLPNPLPFRFDSDGSPLTSMNKYAFILLMVAVQIVSALVAMAIVRTIIGISKNMFKASEAPINLEGLVSLMSNMVLLPQVILAYLLVDTLIYAGWNIHVISFTLFSIGAVVIGTVILLVQFLSISSRARNAISKQ
jgi:uncharacterized membrane protein